MKIKFIFLTVLLFLVSNAATANIYWLYEFYNIAPSFNIFSINDDKYQKCLKGKLNEAEYKKAVEELSC